MWGYCKLYCCALKVMLLVWKFLNAGMPRSAGLAIGLQHLVYYKHIRTVNNNCLIKQYRKIPALFLHLLEMFYQSTDIIRHINWQVQLAGKQIFLSHQQIMGISCLIYQVMKISSWRHCDFKPVYVLCVEWACFPSEEIYNFLLQLYRLLLCNKNPRA